MRVTWIIMWIQVAASALEMVVVFLEAAIIQEHGQEMSALGWFAVIEDPVVFLLGVVAATSRPPVR